MAASTIFFSPPAAITLIASARRKTPRKSSPRIVKRSTPALVPLPLRSGSGVGDGGDATTYTRLPPKDSFVDPSLEVTLRDFFQELRPKDQFPIAEESQEEPLGIEHDEGGEGTEEIFAGSNFESDGEDGAAEQDLKDFPWEDDDMGDDAKEKGVPAVMRCFDRTKIYVRSGDGGSGAVAFRRELFVPHGGPSGGDGGKGGDVYLEVDGSMNSLLSFRKAMHFRAGTGSHGQGKNQVGAKGEDVVVKVAPGTVIIGAVKDGVEGADGGFSLELLHPGQRVLLLPGGRGGKGNASFKSGANRAPKISEKGEHGTEMWLDLELKLVADVGIVGAPNAGKSTLLSAISAAEPTIANYPFTTLLPNLGVVSLNFNATMVVADLPGLLEGAHRGFGLGHEFLRHTERCSVLVHVVDGSGQQPEYEFDAIRLELELFSPELAEKPYIVAFNKMDLPEAFESWELFKKHLEGRGIRLFSISALNRQGTGEVVHAAYQLLQKELSSNMVVEERTDPEDLNHVAEAIKKQRSISMNDFEIFHEDPSDTWSVVGAGIERFVQMTNWQYGESMRRFQHVLEACGMNKALKKHGIKDGDTVIIGEMEMVWNDDTKDSGAPATNKRSSDHVKWPQFK